jgi:hypothetical protein
VISSSQSTRWRTRKNNRKKGWRRRRKKVFQGFLGVLEIMWGDDEFDSKYVQLLPG